MRRTLAAALALAALLATTSTAASAAELHGPPVTVEQCWDGGGGVATDLATHLDYCDGGEYDGRIVVGF